MAFRVAFTKIIKGKIFFNRRNLNTFNGNNFTSSIKKFDINNFEWNKLLHFIPFAPQPVMKMTPKIFEDIRINKKDNTIIKKLKLYVNDHLNRGHDLINHPELILPGLFGRTAIFSTILQLTFLYCVFILYYILVFHKIISILCGR